MKKLFFVIALLVSGISLTYAQSINIVSDDEYNNIRKVKGTGIYTRDHETGRRGPIIRAGASYSPKAAEGFNATLAASYQFGKNGGAQVGVRAEGGSTTVVEGFFKQALGRYHSESWIIPEIGAYAGASEQLMWSGASTDPSAPQGVAMKVACPRFAFCAAAELSIKLKPAPKKEPRFFIELYGGYRVTPYWGKEMSDTILDNSKVYPIDNPMSKQFGHGYVGVAIGFAIYRLK